MSTITMKMKDGTTKEFPESSRPGGSWSTTIRYENGFAIVKDAYGNETAVPSENIDEVRVTPSHGSW